jgi:hypothetical protein
MDRHVKILGTLNMVFGAAGFLGALIAIIAGGGFAGLYSAFNEDVIGFLAVASIIFHLVMGLPCFIGGFFVRKLVDWARVFLIVVSAVNVLNAPFGTLLGAYGLWVLLLPETEPLFEEVRPGQRQTASASRRTTAIPAAAKKRDGTEGSTASVVPSTPK